MRLGLRWPLPRWPERSWYLIALRFVRLVAGKSIELQGTARLLSTTLKKQFITRGDPARQRWRRPPARCQHGRHSHGHRHRDLVGRSRRGAFRRNPRALPVLRQRRSEAHGGALPSDRERGRMNVRAAARSRYAGRPVRVHPGPDHRVRLCATGVGALGPDDVWLLLSGVRHVHRRERRTSGERSRQSRPPSQPRHALPQGTLGAPHHCGRWPRPESAAERERPVRGRQLVAGARDDGGKVPRGAGQAWAWRRGRHQHGAARDRGVLRARQARAARAGHATTTTATRHSACRRPCPATSDHLAATDRPAPTKTSSRPT